MFPKQDIIWLQHGDKNVEKRGPDKLMFFLQSSVRFNLAET